MAAKIANGVGVRLGLGLGACATTPTPSSLSYALPPLLTPNRAAGSTRQRAARTHNSLRLRASSSPSSHNLPSSSAQGIENVVIIGSGPAGYTAAIYAARANMKPVVFEGYQSGGGAGGQLMTTTEVENFPGFPDGISGPDLMDRMRRQAERWGAELFQEDVEFIDVKNSPFTVQSSEHKFISCGCWTS